MGPQSECCRITNLVLCITGLVLFMQSNARAYDNPCGSRERWVNEKCEPCPKCPAGQGYPKDGPECGFGKGANLTCVPCPAGTYRLADDPTMYCKTCLDCEGSYNEVYLYKCRPQINAVCGECMPGFESQGNGTFVKLPCTKCDNTSKSETCVKWWRKKADEEQHKHRIKKMETEFPILQKWKNGAIVFIFLTIISILALIMIGFCVCKKTNSQKPYNHLPNGDIVEPETLTSLVELGQKQAEQDEPFLDKCNGDIKLAVEVKNELPRCLHLMTSSKQGAEPQSSLEKDDDPAPEGNRTPPPANAQNPVEPSLHVPCGGIAKDMPSGGTTGAWGDSRSSGIYSMPYSQALTAVMWDRDDDSIPCVNSEMSTPPKQQQQQSWKTSPQEQMQETGLLMQSPTSSMDQEHQRGGIRPKTLQIKQRDPERRPPTASQDVQEDDNRYQKAMAKCKGLRIKGLPQEIKNQLVLRLKSHKVPGEMTHHDLAEDFGVTYDVHRTWETENLIQHLCRQDVTVHDFLSRLDHRCLLEVRNYLASQIIQTESQEEPEHEDESPRNGPRYPVQDTHPPETSISGANMARAIRGEEEAVGGEDYALSERQVDLEHPMYLVPQEESKGPYQYPIPETKQASSPLTPPPHTEFHPFTEVANVNGRRR